jgi:cellulose synthase/poly-beta-1,6-N-acetylglucosamine synthase-like glycosyltransferase
MKAFIILFLAGATILWLSVFGYVLFLWVLTPRSRRRGEHETALPDIAVVIPVLNEEGLIQAKLSDLRGGDYPPDRIAFLVVDGGSMDRTAEIVRHEAAADPRIRLVNLRASNGQSDQVTLALGLVTQDIVIVTDADSTLETSCISELVRAIQEDLKTAVVGATVEPMSVLPEERIHWWFVSLLWWIEGEVLSAAPLSGVCYACRRDSVLPLSRDAHAEDIHVALASGARGFRVRICRTAHARELRVPQTLGDIFRYRRRRGAGYLSELLRTRSAAQTPLGWRLARCMRLLHFMAIPKLAAALVIAGLVLLFTPYRALPPYALAAFALPVLIAPFFSPVLIGERNRWWRLPWAALRLAGLTLASMLSLRSSTRPQGPTGGRS